MASECFGLTAQVKDHLGSPTIFVDGKPTSPLMYFGWAAGGGPNIVKIDTEWKQYHLTFTSPEDTDGASGVHFRVGKDGPGTVWVDDIQLYEGEKVKSPQENLIRQGDWEGTTEQLRADWTLYQAEYADAQATWDTDATTKVTGKQSLRIDIKNPGGDRMHLHFYQKGLSVKKGQRYTYSLWMKADRLRTVDFMALHIGGPWTIYASESSHHQNQVRLARDAGVRVYSFGISMPWPKPGEEPNFSGVDRAILATLAVDPDGLLLPRFGMAPPPWWLEEHPESKMLFDDGEYEGWSMASEPWREEMQTHLRALVRYCEDKYGPNMLGYHPCGQHTGEWFYYRSWEPRLSDFSPAMSLGFGKWVRGRYGTVEALREAWNDPGVTFEGIVVPSKEEQLHTELGWFRDPALERKTIDYFEYKQLAMEEPLQTMARVIKDETNRAKLVCLFYGYLFDMHGIPMGPQTSGHLAMGKLIQCPDVDILCSPISYLDRQLGGVGCFMCAVDSVREGGKLWLNEDDTRTYLTPEDAGFGRVASRQGTFWVHQRNFAQLWPRRLACWYMDLGNAGWLNGEDIWDNIAPMQEYFRANINRPARWSPDVVLIVDEKSPCYAKCDRTIQSPMVYQMRSQFFRCGTAFRIHLLSDLVAGKVPPAKAYFFANCYHLNDVERQAVLAATADKTAVWFYGGGFLNEDASCDNMTSITGLMMQPTAAQSGTVTLEKAGWLAQGLTDDFGNPSQLEPCWTSAEEDMDVAALYAGGVPAVFGKQTPQGLRVYIGTPHCPARLLRNILKRSGIHLYSDGDDVILTDGEFLSVTATSAGHKVLSFEEPCDVLNALDGTVVAEAVQRLELDLELGETRMFTLR